MIGTYPDNYDAVELAPVESHRLRRVRRPARLIGVNVGEALVVLFAMALICSFVLLFIFGASVALRSVMQ